jgi:hypothetical protein
LDALDALDSGAAPLPLVFDVFVQIQPPQQRRPQHPGFKVADDPRISRCRRRIPSAEILSFQQL